MPIYEIERDECIWERWTYMVEADSLADAIDELCNGDSVVYGQKPEYLCDGPGDDQIHRVLDENGEVLWAEESDSIDDLYPAGDPAPVA